MNGHLEVVKLLLTYKGVDPRVDNNFSIVWASRSGHFEIVKFLLESGVVKPMNRYIDAINAAQIFGRWKVVELLEFHFKEENL